nr:hypothetical protein [Tanacetum cinerariifolium]
LRRRTGPPRRDSAPASDWPDAASDNHPATAARFRRAMPDANHRCTGLPARRASAPDRQCCHRERSRRAVYAAGAWLALRSERRAQLRFKHSGVEFLADQHQPGFADFVGLPGAIKVLVEACADALNQQAHRLARDGGKALDAQDAVLHNRLSQRVEQQRFIRLGQVDRDRVKRIMVVIVSVIAFMVIVMGLAAINVQLGLGTQAQQHADRQLALAGLDDFHRRRQLFGHLGTHGSQCSGIEHVSLVENDQVSTRQLIREQLVQRRFVVQVRVQLALGIDLIRERRERAGQHRRAVDHGDHGVDGAGVADFRPLKGLDQRLGQRQPRGFDQDVVEVAATGNQLLHHREEFFLNGAAQAAVGQFVHPAKGFFLGATDGALLEDVAVDAQLAEFVDDDRDTPALGIVEHVPQQGGFARAEKAVAGAAAACDRIPFLAPAPIKQAAANLKCARLRSDRRRVNRRCASIAGAVDCTTTGRADAAVTGRIKRPVDGLIDGVRPPWSPTHLVTGALHRVKRETGARRPSGAQVRCCPRNGKRAKRQIHCVGDDMGRWRLQALTQ